MKITTNSAASNQDKMVYSLFSDAGKAHAIPAFEPKDFARLRAGSRYIRAFMNSLTGKALLGWHLRVNPNMPMPDSFTLAKSFDSAAKCPPKAHRRFVSNPVNKQIFNEILGSANYKVNERTSAQIKAENIALIDSVFRKPRINWFAVFCLAVGIALLFVAHPIFIGIAVCGLAAVIQGIDMTCALRRRPERTKLLAASENGYQLGENVDGSKICIFQGMKFIDSVPTHTRRAPQSDDNGYYDDGSYR
jgi:hypothetical protein